MPAGRFNDKTSVAALSVVSNTILTVLKVVVGVLTGSVAVLSEAAHSATDLVAALVAFFAVRMSGRDADERHPYGHGKFENISGTVEALLIFVAAVWIIYEAVEKLVHPQAIDMPVWGAGVMLVSALVNTFVSRRLFRVGRRADSIALQADGWHLRTDVYTSVGVMVALFVIWVIGVARPGLDVGWLDSAVALVVALMILKAAWDLTRQSVRDLLDVSLPEEDIQWVAGFVSNRWPAVRSLHHLRTRKAGPTRFIDFHMVVDGQMPVAAAHSLADEVVAAIKDRMPDSRVYIHVEPCDLTCRTSCLEGCTVDHTDVPKCPSIGDTWQERSRPTCAIPRRRTMEKPGRRLVEEALASGAPALDEEAGKRFFADYGITVPQGGTVRSAEEAVRLAGEIGYPVVMKGSSTQVQHKTDAGLVLLRIGDEQEVRDGYRTLESRAAAAGAKLDGVLVEHMVTGKREFVVGLIRDRLFGPVVMFGLGGIFTEALKDVAFAVAPVSEDDAYELMDQIEARTMLAPFRGEPAVDRDALARIIMAVGQMAEDHPEIGEIDVNPLLVDGSTPVAVDALVTVGEPVEVSTRPPADISRLDSLVAPTSVAVVGASSDTAKWGGMLVANLRLGGFPGPIYLVNPKGGSILGLPVHKTLGDLPETPDLVIVAVAASLVGGVVEECGRRGVGAVVVVSAGFSEVGAEGRALEEEMVRTAERYGMALVGPNCMGVISAHHKLYGTGFMLLRPQPGGASMVSQSGNLGTQLLVSAERRQGGVGKFIGVGNEAMIDAVDFINYLHSDPKTNTIVAYMEGFDDGRRLLDVVSRTSLDKPVVVLKGGMSDYGKKAAASHTGALTSSTAVFEAAARQSGMIVVTDPDEFMDLTFALAYMPLPPGKRVAVATLGGGWGVLVSDELSRCRLELADLSPRVIADLDKVLPAFWSHSNPVDMVATTTPGVPEAVVEALAASDGVDAVIVMGVVGSMNESRRAITEIEGLKARVDGHSAGGDAGDEVEEAEPELSGRELEFIRQTAALMDRYCKPIVNISFKPMTQAIFSVGGRYSTFVLPSPLRAVRILGKMASYSAYLRKKGVDRTC